MEFTLGIIAGILLAQVSLIASVYLAYKRATPLDWAERKARPKAVILTEHDVLKDEIEKLGDTKLENIL